MEHDHGGMAAPFVVLGNEVAAAVADKHPGMHVDMLAYTFAEDAPNQSAPLPVEVQNNLIARWAPIDIDQAYPLARQRSPGSYSSTLAAEQLASWSAMVAKGGGKLYSWLYWNNYHDLLMPLPDWFNLAEDIQLLAEHGARGIFAEVCTA